jgi:hypothetical protein
MENIICILCPNYTQHDILCRVISASVSGHQTIAELRRRAAPMAVPYEHTAFMFKITFIGAGSIGNLVAQAAVGISGFYVNLRVRQEDIKGER